MDLAVYSYSLIFKPAALKRLLLGVMLNPWLMFDPSKPHGIQLILI